MTKWQRLVAVAGVLLALATVPPVSAQVPEEAPAADGAEAAVEPEAKAAPGPPPEQVLDPAGPALSGLAPMDDLIIDQPTPDGYVLVRARGGQPLDTLARLAEDGLETSMWTGVTCRTGNGRYLASVFAPVEGLDDPVYRDRGAYGAVFDLDTNELFPLPERVAFKYHAPGCGPDDEMTFVRYLGADQATTEVLTVDGRGQIVDVLERPGHLTSPAPVGDVVYAAADSAVVALDRDDPSSDALLATSGTAFDLHATGDGTLDLLTTDGQTGVTMLHADGQQASVVGRAPLGQIDLVGGRAGATNVVLGPDAVLDEERPVVRSEEPVQSVSLGGSVSATSNFVDPGTDEEGTGKIEVRPVAADGTRLAEVGVGLGAPGDAVAELEPPTTSVNTTTPVCAVPRLDPTIMAKQPTGQQVEWAVNNIVRGQLTVTRPANWNGNGLPSYTPQAQFPLPAIRGGGRIPAQVLLGVLAQESNLQQAGKGALPGVPGNPLVSNYYGTLYTNGLITGMDYDLADCGYGIAQVTDGMRIGQTKFTAAQQKMIATDYTANILAGAQILIEKWNAAYDQGLLINGGDPSRIEHWYFAVWAYNSGIYPTAPTGPYGVGWTNNPANTDWKPDRGFFLRLDSADAARPYFWPYQEKIMGWAENGQYQGGNLAFAKATTGTTGHLSLPQIELTPGVFSPDPAKLCTALNDCSLAYEPNRPANYVWTKENPVDDLWHCTRSDRKCWWHGATTFPTATGTETARFVGQAEPTSTSPYPPACNVSGSEPPSGESSAIFGPGTVVVDDVPVMPTISGCPATPNPGTFTLKYGDGSPPPTAAIDFHQIGAGYGGHFYYAHIISRDRPANLVTGTWKPPAAISGWTRVLVHMPDHGADTAQAEYTIDTGTKKYKRTVNQRWNKKIWVDLGIFQMGAGASVSLTNAVYNEHFVSIPVDVAYDAVAFVPSSKPTLSMVALGDSYSAGDGNAPYYPDSDIGGQTPLHIQACHRSPESHPVHVYAATKQQWGGTSTFHSSACSGSTMNNVSGTLERFWEVPQLEQGWLDENTTLVSLQIGGNDVRFVDILIQCAATLNCADPSFVMPDYPKPPATTPLVQYQAQVIDDQLVRMKDTLKAIKAKAPNAAIAFVGYPHLIANPFNLSLACNPLVFSTPEVQWFESMSNRMSDVMKQAVDEVNLELNMVSKPRRAYFVDIRSRFDGKEACSFSGDQQLIYDFQPTSSSGSGTSIPGSGSYHPNAAGQRAYADEIMNVLPDTPPSDVEVGSTYSPITPYRVLDSRTSNGGWGSTPLSSGSPRNVKVAGVGGVPASAVAVVMNVTAAGSTAESFLTLYPRSTPLPNASNLNFVPGQTVPNLVTTRVGSLGEVTVATAAGSTHVIIDVLGYYEAPGALGSKFYGTTPTRILDSRGTVGGWPGSLAGQRDLQVTGGSSGVPSSATAVAINLTVSEGTAESFLQAWPAGLSRPAAGSNLNFAGGQIISNLAVVGIGTGGKISIYNHIGQVHVVADVVGYFGDIGTGGLFHPLSPTRLLDSRNGNGLSGRFTGGTARTLQVGGRGSIPVNATGVVMNTSAVGASDIGILAVYPGPSVPTISNLFYVPGRVVPNLVMVKLSSTGTVDIWPSGGTLDVVGDAAGYFATT